MPSPIEGVTFRADSDQHAGHWTLIQLEAEFCCQLVCDQSENILLVPRRRHNRQMPPINGGGFPIPCQQLIRSFNLVIAKWRFGVYFANVLKMEQPIFRQMSLRRFVLNVSDVGRIS